jgi:hypothetical protein
MLLVKNPEPSQSQERNIDKLRRISRSDREMGKRLEPLRPSNDRVSPGAWHSSPAAKHIGFVLPWRRCLGFPHFERRLLANELLPRVCMPVAPTSYVIQISIFSPLDEKDFLAAMRRGVHDMLPRPVCLRLKDTPTVAEMTVDAASPALAPGSTARAICEEFA